MRFVSFVIIIALIGLITALDSWHAGYKAGYNTAIADVELGVVKPEEFIKKGFPHD